MSGLHPLFWAVLLFFASLSYGGPSPEDMSSMSKLQSLQGLNLSSMTKEEGDEPLGGYWLPKVELGGKAATNGYRLYFGKNGKGLYFAMPDQQMWEIDDIGPSGSVRLKKSGRVLTKENDLQRMRILGKFLLSRYPDAEVTRIFFDKNFGIKIRPGSRTPVEQEPMESGIALSDKPAIVGNHADEGSDVSGASDHPVAGIGDFDSALPSLLGDDQSWKATKKPDGSREMVHTKTGQIVPVSVEEAKGLDAFLGVKPAAADLKAAVKDLEVSPKTWEELVKRADQLGKNEVKVVIGADWCGPCMFKRGKMEKGERELPDLMVWSSQSETDAPPVVQYLGIETYPSEVTLVKGANGQWSKK